MTGRRWTLTGSDARSPMSLDTVASGPSVSMSEHIEVMPVSEHLAEIAAIQHQRDDIDWKERIA